jgi:hypothetical protein
VQSLPQVPQLWTSSGTQTPLHTNPEHPWLPSPPSKGAASAVASVAASLPASGAGNASLFVVASPGADPSGPDASVDPSFVFGGVRSWMPRHPVIDAAADEMAIEARIVRNKVSMRKAPRCARGDVTPRCAAMQGDHRTIRQNRRLPRDDAKQRTDHGLARIRLPALAVEPVSWVEDHNPPTHPFLVARKEHTAAVDPAVDSIGPVLHPDDVRVGTR